MNSDNLTYFDSFEVEHIKKKEEEIHRQQKYHDE